MSFWTAGREPGNAPAAFLGLRHRVRPVRRRGVVRDAFPSPRRRTPRIRRCAVSLIVAVLTALVLPLRRVWPGPVFGVDGPAWRRCWPQWPVRGALFPVALAIGLYTVAATMSRAAALVAAALAVAAELPAAGQGGWHDSWLAAIYEVIAIARGPGRGPVREHPPGLPGRAARPGPATRTRTRPDQRAGRGGGAGPHRPGDARQRRPPPHRHRGAFRRRPGRGHPRPRPGLATRSGACRAPPGRRSPRPAACSASCGPRTAWSSASRSLACPTSTACSPGSGRPGCRSGTNAAVRPRTRRPASSWSSSGSSRKP